MNVRTLISRLTEFAGAQSISTMRSLLSSSPSPSLPAASFAAPGGPHRRQGLKEKISLTMAARGRFNSSKTATP